MAAFYTVGSVQYEGYKLTQRGSQVVLEAEDIDNPFQVWYKDDWWRFTQDKAGRNRPAFALINNGSKAALRADSTAPPSHVSLFTHYDRSKDTTLTTAWTLRAACSSSADHLTIFSVALQKPLSLGTGTSAPESGDGVAAVIDASAQLWTLDAFVPKAYVLQSQWANQILVAKPPHTDVTFTSGSGSFNNELGVVAVYQANTNEVQEVWYKVPAASPLEDSNSSFFVFSKLNGKALKGSTKPGDKVILTEFDALDNNFVWSEDRSLSNGQSYLAINLANSGTTKLHWFLPPDNEYQNAPYNHPLTLRQATTLSDRSQWRFIPFTS